jgi:predicted transcriptional regulator
MSGWFRSDWRALTPRQQNLLRALSAEEDRPFAADVRRQYDLRSSAAVARSLELLMQKGLVIRSEKGYAVDNPFFRHWVARSALPDVGPRDS